MRKPAKTGRKPAKVPAKSAKPAAKPVSKVVAKSADRKSTAKSSAKTAAKSAAIKSDAKAAPAALGADARMVEELGSILARLDLAEVEVERNGLRVRVTRLMAQQVSAHAAHHPAPAAPAHSVIAPPPLAVAAPVNALSPAEAAADHAGAVKSPMVGTAYRRPSPDAKAFIEVGSQVKAGEKILLIEAMKTFNEIVAPRAGTVLSIHIDDGQPVEYGQTLVVIE
jgi:acetyl-CoA carboxylase biotin carboxyl carrier protein